LFLLIIGGTATDFNHFLESSSGVHKYSLASAVYISVHEDASTVFLDFSPCSLADMYQHFRGNCYLRAQDKKKQA
jgi:hypothetical protein